MIFTWNIYVHGRFAGQVACISESTAKKKYYMANGGASRYTGLGMDAIEARRAR